MLQISKITRYGAGMLLAAVAIISCQKLDRPSLPEYPKDSNPPGGPLKFYVAFDGTTANPLMNTVDSIRANFPASNTVASADGVSGKDYKGSETTFIQYASANDFAKSTSFTIAFWLKKTPQAAGKGTNFAFALNSKDYSWTNLKMFLEFEDAGNPSTTDSASAKFYLLDQWFEYTGVKRMPKVLNGTWHHLAFVYDETTSMLSTYIDGVPDANLPPGFGKVVNGSDPRGKLDLTSGKGITGFTLGGAGDVAFKANSWMGNFDGEMDQFRLYGTALSAADIAALYTTKK